MILILWWNSDGIENGQCGKLPSSSDEYKFGIVLSVDTALGI